MVGKILCFCILGIGLVALIGYFIDNADVSRSSAWPTVDGRLDSIEDRSVSLPLLGRYMPLTTPYAAYAYSVNDKDYHGQKISGPCVSWVRMFTFTQPPIVEHDAAKAMADAASSSSDPNQVQVNMKRAVEKEEQLILHPEYKPVKVRYDAAHPEQSVLDPSVLQSGRSQMVTAALLMSIGGLGLLATFIHTMMIAPVQNDPTLSLDAALAAQRGKGKR